MNNNLIFNQDPVLYNSNISPQYTNPNQDPTELKRQLDTVMAQYQAFQTQQMDSMNNPQLNRQGVQQVDYIGDLDNTINSLDKELTEKLMANPEFVQLNTYIQQAIQAEIINSIRWKINSNPEIVNKVNRAYEIINVTQAEKDQENRKNLSELNDYIQNYSDMTFNEYKKLKNNQ